MIVSRQCTKQVFFAVAFVVFMIGCEEEFFHVSTPAAGCPALQHSVCLLTGEGASVIQAVRRSTAVQYGYRLYDTFFSVFYHSFPALYASGYEFQRNVFVGGVQIIGFSLIDKAAYHVVGRCKRCYLTHPVGDVYGAYVGEPGVKSLCFQQCAEQE